MFKMLISTQTDNYNSRKKCAIPRKIGLKFQNPKFNILEQAK